MTRCLIFITTMRRKEIVKLTKEQEEIIIKEYADSTNSEELAVRLGLPLRKLYIAANNLGIKKSGAARSAISAANRRY